MNFWQIYYNDHLRSDFGTSRVLFTTKPRSNTSLSSISDKFTEIGINEVKFMSYDPNGLRYLIAKDITYDILISIYDVNSSRIMCMRITQAIDDKNLQDIKKITSFFGTQNIEIRIIGNQNNNKDVILYLYGLEGIIKNNELVEIDLFGNEKRNICIDTKTGQSYNLLLDNRHYFPGELINNMKIEEFKSKIGPLKNLNEFNRKKQDKNYSH
jgi:hypothetical protein